MRLRLNWSTFGLILIALAFAISQAIAPLFKLYKLKTYFSPFNLLENNHTKFIIYLALLLVIVITYLLLANLKANLKKGTLFGLLLIIFLTVLFAYPPIYDPLYYHAASWLWGVMHVSPYTGMMSFFATHRLPYIQIPILNNYAYGPIWLLITNSMGWTTGYHLATFILLLKTLAFLSVVATAIAASKLKGETSLTKAIFVLVFNPITLAYVLPAGTQEALLSLLLVVGLITLKKSPIIAITLLTTAALTKFSAAPILLLAIAWLIGQAIHVNAISRIKSFLQICVPIFVLSLITILVFGINSNYFSGVHAIATYDQFNLINLPWLLAKILKELFAHTQLTPIILKIAFLTALNTIYGFLVLAFTFNLLKNHDYGSLLKYSWIILLAAIGLTGIHPQPWYYFPPLATSLLLKKEYIRQSIIITTFAMFAVLSLELLKVVQKDPTARLGLAVFTVLAYTIPTLYYIYKNTAISKRLQLLIKDSSIIFTRESNSNR